MTKLIAVCLFSVLGLAAWSLTDRPAALVNTSSSACLAELADCMQVSYEVCGSNTSCIRVRRAECMAAYNACN